MPGTVTMQAVREHPCESQLNDFLLGKLDQPEALAVEHHLDLCDSCCESVYTLSQQLGQDAQLIRLRLCKTISVNVDEAPDPGQTRLVRRNNSEHAPDTTSGKRQKPDAPLWTMAGYEILEKLGQGGVSVVYRARDVRLKREVALKVLRAGAPPEDQQPERFRAEAEIIARLRHENIVQIYEVGEENGQPYLVLELIEGGDLYDLARHRPQPPRTAAAWVETLARTVAFAHEHDVIHRDLKPGNVLVVHPPEGHDGAAVALKITDFGLAKQLDLDSDLTRTGVALGTPGYMAPEQVAGRAAGPAADVYALGAILYELLTGQPPFQADTAFETLRRTCEDDPLPPRRLQPGVPIDLQTICLKCLEKEPARRYASAEALAEDLRRFQAGEPIKARPVNTLERVWKWAKRRPTLASLLLLSAVVLAFGAPTLALLWLSAEKARDKAEVALYYSLIHQADLEFRSLNVSQARHNLQRCASERRGWEWHYLDRLTQAEQVNLGKHRDPVYSLAFSPDGRYLASGGGVLPSVRATGLEPGELCVWDLKTGARVLDLSGKTLAVTSLSFSRDSQRLALSAAEIKWARKREIKIWDFSQRAFLPQFQQASAHKKETPRVVGNFTNVGLSPDGRHLALFVAGDIALWDVATGRKAFTLPEQSAFCFGPEEGALRTAGQDGSITQWDQFTGRKLRVVSQVHVDKPFCCCFSGDARLLAWVSEQDNDTILLRDGLTGTILRRLHGHAGAVERVAFDPAGRYLASAGDDGTVRLWDVKSGRSHYRFLGHTDRVVSLAFSPDGTRLASAGWDGVIKVWDLTHPPEYVRVGQAKTFVEDMAFRANGEELVSAQVRNGTLQRWDAATGKLKDERHVKVVDAHGAPARRLAFDRTGGRLAAPAQDDARVLKIWDMARGEELLALRGHTLPIQFACFSADGRRIASVACSPRGSGLPLAWEWRVWDAASGRLLREYGEEGQVCSGLALSPQGRLLAATGRPAKLAAGSSGPKSWVRVWDANRGQLVGELSDLPISVVALAFDPAGSRLATGDMEGNVVMRQATSLAPLWTNQRPGTVWNLTFSPDGRRLAAATREAVTLWDAEAGEEALTLHGPPREGDPQFNPRVVFSPDGHRLAVNHWNRTVTIWDARPRGQ